MKEELQKQVREFCKNSLAGNITQKHIVANAVAVPLRWTRTVRNVSMDVTPKPIISKRFVDLSRNDETSYLNDNRNVKELSDTVLDKIIRRLRSDCCPSEVVLLITPASKHKNQFKLHMIDRVLMSHVGMTSITKKELLELKVSKAFEQYCIIIGTKYINLKNVALNSALIENLMNVVDGKCCGNKCRDIQPTKNLPSPRCKLATTKYMKPKEQKIVAIVSSKKTNKLNNPRLVQLMERINTTGSPCTNDLQKFFDMAEKYKFNIYIRPELCWKNTPELDNGLPYDLPRFNIECFMLFDTYVGGITLDSEQLEHQLSLHPNLLSRVQIISDVCEITPIPRTLATCLRKLCDWFGMEMLYDAFGEYIFDIYKDYA